MGDEDKPIPWDFIGVGITIALASLAIGLYGEKVNPGGQTEQSARPGPSRDIKPRDSGPSDTERGGLERRDDTTRDIPREDAGT